MTRRRDLVAGLSMIGMPLGAREAAAAERAAPTPQKTERFPGDPPEHKLVYQLNQPGDEHLTHILTSIGAVIGRHGDNVAIAVVAFGSGIHLLAKRPQRPVSDALKARARSQAETYHVRFIACGNTMKTFDWQAADMVDFAQVEEVGAASLMELQEQGYAYIAW